MHVTDVGPRSRHALASVAEYSVLASRPHCRRVNALLLYGRSSNYLWFLSGMELFPEDRHEINFLSIAIHWDCPRIP